MSRIERKCCLCDVITKEPMTNFSDIGWSAFKIGCMNSICFCPLHRDQMMKVFDEKWDEHYGKKSKGKVNGND